MLRLVIAFAAALMTSPAAAQVQYWLPNGPGGTTYNNPQGSLSGSYYERELQRYADRQRWARERQQQQQQQQQGGRPAVAGAASGMAGSHDPSFRLNNAGGRTIREVYVSSARNSQWGQDWLGSSVLQPGQRLTIALPMGQCLNDIRVVFMDGRAQEQRQVNTCALTDLAFR